MKLAHDFRVLSVAALAGVTTISAGINSAQAQDTLIPTLGDDSLYNISAGSSDDYAFQTPDGSYYNFDIAEEKMSTSSSISWQEVTESGENTVSVAIPNNGGTDVKYYKYTYTKPATYTSTSERVTDVSTSDVTDVLFENIEGTTVGAAIYNKTTDNSDIDIVADFLNNTSSGGRGMIYVDGGGSLGDIKGNYINNSVITTGLARGGAISSWTGNFKNITGDYIGNYAEGNSWATGGAIDVYEASSVKDIVGNFIGNYTKAKTQYSYGGAIHLDNRTSIDNITGKFIGNYALSNSSSVGSFGGAIMNAASSTIGNITSDFISNYAKSNTLARGGAICNENKSLGAISNISGNFIGNYAEGLIVNAGGGAIHNSGSVTTIKGNFISNYSKGISGSRGGAISLTGSGNTKNIIGTFIENRAITDTTDAVGGAIAIWHNSSSLTTLENLDSNFYSNYAKANTGYAYGGAVHNIGHIGDIEQDEYISNYAESVDGNARGGAINNTGVIGNLDADGNLVGGIINTVFTGNYAKSTNGEAHGGAIYTSSDLNLIAQDNYTFDISGNWVEDVNGTRQEAIYVATDTSNMGVQREHIGTIDETGQWIYQDTLVGAEPTTLTLYAKDNSLFVIDDQIVGSPSETKEFTYLKNPIMDRYDEELQQWVEDVYLDENGEITDNPEYITEVVDAKSVLSLKGDNANKIYFNNDIKNLNIEHNNVTTYVDGMSYLNQPEALNSLTMNSGTLNLGSLNSSPLLFDTFSMNGGVINIDNVEVDLANETMGRISANNYTEAQGGTINVNSMTIVSDSADLVTAVEFADKSFKNTVNSKITEVYTPIYKYEVEYDTESQYGQLDENGYFIFKREARPAGSNGGGSGSVDSYNPAVLGSSSTATVGALGTMNQTFNYAFEHSMNYMHIPYVERIALKDRNKYALSITGDATDMGRFSPLYQPSDESSSVWVKPYATFENVPLKNGPKVSNITYGTLVGFDSEMQSLKRGWDRVWTGYIGYNGASQRYSGIDSTQNGGLIGGTMTLYKGNFFNAITVSVGANVANNQTMYGSEDFAMLLSGIGNKTGYNFEFKGGKCILQPSLLMSYTFVNTFDYTNAAGVRIDNKPLHALQLAPGVKVIGNLKGGWQPYASVSMVWNLMGESDATANGVKLPEMSIKPYVQYGVGLQKRIKDHFMAYGQAMVQNGGRNGVSLTAGFRWALGHDCKYENQKVDAKKQDKISSSNEILRSAQNDGGKSIGHYEEQSDVVISSNNEIATPLARNDKHKKILKQMTPEQKMVYGGRHNTSRTVMSGALKQL